MNCDKEAVELMHKYLDKDMTTEDQAKLAQHLENCEDCQKHFHELKRTISFIKSAEQIEAPPDFTQKVMASLPTEKSGLNICAGLRFTQY
ncbi:anti-sigma factor family protein [Tigheibacillus jepli]|uniref:anti-sigma factor family protein n=1 Tax=Tigheibacillus jepli TaxID=3035914 RepID=UPI00387E1741